MPKPKIDVRSNESCYVTVNGLVFYIEVSEMTKNKPFISCWPENSTSDEADVITYRLDGLKIDY